MAEAWRSEPAAVVLEPRYLYPAEDEVARRWWALPTGARLQLDDGTCCHLLFAGHPGSSSGPDVHDAVLARDDAGQTLVGDVEFHVRASDWFVHCHHTDARYNRVVLHVVLLCDDTESVRRQDGSIVPTCSLYDLPSLTRALNQSTSSDSPILAAEPSRWPCHDVMGRLSAEERQRLLCGAGLLRFEQKADAFVEAMHAAPGEHKQSGQSRWHPCDACLLAALAEALAYGRDRAFFRAAGLYLLGLDGASHVPDPLGRGDYPSPLDASRLRVLRHLLQRWQNGREAEAVSEIREYLALPPAQALDGLRALFTRVGLSRSRTDIVLCNVVLPFAAAVGRIEGDSTLTAAARQLYLEHPGLPSNRVTRVMCAQLQLGNQPHGSCVQQGLHHIYQSTCREKHCTACLVGKWDL
ncbi:MAG TPA: DUF2851 family protein [Ktedonobacteraceae bacterium]|nr:DUF2851 family protein [Ktedonobacteraceae bacterium]